MGINGNKNQIPLGIHYCQTESSSNWRNFLMNLLSVYLDWNNQNLHLVIFMDRLIDLDSVILEVLPHCTHRMCLFLIN